MIVGQQLLVAGVAMKMQAPCAARAAGGSEQQLQLQLQLQPNQRSINQRRSPLLSSPRLPCCFIYINIYIIYKQT